MSEMHHYQWNIKTALNAENKVGVKYANIIIIEASAHWDYKYFLYLQPFQMFLFFFNENVLLGWLIKLFTIFIDKKCVDVAMFVWFNLANLIIRIFYLKTYIWAHSNTAVCSHGGLKYSRRMSPRGSSPWDKKFSTPGYYYLFSVSSSWYLVSALCQGCSITIIHWQGTQQIFTELTIHISSGLISLRGYGMASLNPESHFGHSLEWWPSEIHWGITVGRGANVKLPRINWSCQRWRNPTRIKYTI